MARSPSARLANSSTAPWGRWGDGGAAPAETRPVDAIWASRASANAVGGGAGWCVAERGLMGLRRGFPALWVLGAGWAPPALAVALDRTVAAEPAGRGATGAELGCRLVAADVLPT